MTNVPPPLPAAAPTPAPAPLRRRAGLGSDWLNPILVREVQQAVKGRVFPLTVLLALGVTVAIAAAVASQYRNGGGQGRGAFDAGFAVLVPLLIFVVPMQAYHSMRTELRDGIVEQLLLSRLAPGRILAGKLQAAMVQFVLYVAVLAPLLATSYLLRGVDLPTIALSLLFALIACVVATAFAVSAAAQGVVPALQPIANLGMAFGLGVATFAMIGFIGSGQYARSVGWLIRSGDFGAVVSGVVLGAGVATGIAWLGARSFLLHAFENRSTGFRLCLFVLPVLAYGWMLLFLPASQWSDAFAFLTTILVVIGLVFGIFMVTEQRVLSPRLRAHVPRGTLAAVLATPFLPGRDRGTACLLLYAAALGSLASAYWPASTGGVFDFAGVFGRFGVMATVYGALLPRRGARRAGLPAGHDRRQPRRPFRAARAALPRLRAAAARRSVPARRGRRVVVRACHQSVLDDRRVHARSFRRGQERVPRRARGADAAAGAGGPARRARGAARVRGAPRA
jgi:hypothetical protein